MTVGTWLAILAVTLVAFAAAAVWFVRARYAPLRQRHRELSDLQRLARVLDRTSSVDELVSDAFDEIRSLTGAVAAGLTVFGTEGERLASRAEPAELAGPAARDDHRWRDVIDAAEPVAVARELADPTGASVATTWMAVVVGDDDATLGMLVAGWRDAGDEVARRHLLRAVGLQLVVRLRHAVLRAEAAHVARHDPLTRALNRDEFVESVAEAMRADPSTGARGVAVLDLDRFTDVNEALGHAAGDEILRTTADRIRALLSEGECLARLASDEFGVVIRRGDADEVRRIAHRFARDLGSVSISGVDVLLIGSVGLAMLDDPAVDAAATVRRAEVAARRAKEQRAAVEVYEHRIDRRGPSRLSMLGELREAVDAGSIRVDYQPKMELATGQIVGVEALARWDHPVRGRASTEDLIRVSEDAGLIRAVTDHVLDHALSAAGRWRQEGIRLSVAVNASVRDLGAEFVDRVEAQLARHGVAAGDLTVEITESALLSGSPDVGDAIDRLHRLGVGLALDDYGTGYSSLSQLRRLPVRELKIDRSFVADMLLDEQSAVIVRSTIDLAHRLGLVATAEGVENGTILARLSELGCDLGQGYGISRPLAEPVLRAWLLRAAGRSPSSTDAGTRDEDTRDEEPSDGASGDGASGADEGRTGP